MQINGSIPIHVARAYGVTPPAAAPPAATAQPAPGVSSLVGGRVSQPIDFTAAPAEPSRAPAAYQLYTRAADKIEAAVAVQLGRTIDRLA